MDTHSYTFDQLRPGQGSNEQPYLRILIFLNKHPDVPDEKFHDWWKTVHADLTMTGLGWGVHVTRYVQVRTSCAHFRSGKKRLLKLLEQFHQTAAHKEALKAVGLEPLPFDGMGEMHAPSLEAWFKFSSSPGFQEKLLRKYFHIFPAIELLSLTCWILYRGRSELYGRWYPEDYDWA